MRVSMVIAVFGLGAALAGCFGPVVDSSTPNAVLITGVGARDAGKALRMAEAECAKYGKHAVPLPDPVRPSPASPSVARPSVAASFAALAPVEKNYECKS